MLDNDTWNIRRLTEKGEGVGITAAPAKDRLGVRREDLTQNSGPAAGVVHQGAEIEIEGNDLLPVRPPLQAVQLWLDIGQHLVGLQLGINFDNRVAGIFKLILRIGFRSQAVAV